MNETERSILEATAMSLGARNAERGLLLTLYVPSTDVLRAKALVQAEYSLARNVKDRVTRAVVRDSLRAALSTLTDLGDVPHGLGLFIEGLSVFLWLPPEPILGMVYRCEKTFFLGPMLEMLSAGPVWGLVVMDRSEATLGWTDGRQVELLEDKQSYVMGKHHMGGMSQARYARLIAQQVSAFYDKVSVMASERFLPFGKRLRGILVGGPGHTKDEWVASEGMDYRIRPKVRLPTFSTGYTEEQGLRELLEAARRSGWSASEGGG